MVACSVVDRRNGREKSYGNYVFAALPLVGHQLTIGNAMGGVDLLEVVFVEHQPVEMAPSTTGGRMTAERGPQVSLSVRHVQHIGLSGSPLTDTWY